MYNSKGACGAPPSKKGVLESSSQEPQFVQLHPSSTHSFFCCHLSNQSSRLFQSNIHFTRNFFLLARSRENRVSVKISIQTVRLPEFVNRPPSLPSTPSTPHTRQFSTAKCMVHCVGFSVIGVGVSWRVRCHSRSINSLGGDVISGQRLSEPALIVISLMTAGGITCIREGLGMNSFNVGKVCMRGSGHICHRVLKADITNKTLRPYVMTYMCNAPDFLCLPRS